MERGYRVAIPFGEDHDFDLICWQTPDRLERVQVKHVTSDGRVICVKCTSHSLTNGRVRRTKRYTAATIDWLAVYDRTTQGCYYIPASELAEGRSTMHLRLTAPLNSQMRRIRFACDYRELTRDEPQVPMMEPAGLEPAPSRMQTERSPN